jgi:hypothetical protein
MTDFASVYASGSGFASADTRFRRNTSSAAPDGFTQRRKVRKGRKEGQNEGPLYALRAWRTLRLCVKPCRQPAGIFKPYHYPVGSSVDEGLSLK